MKMRNRIVLFLIAVLFSGAVHASPPTQEMPVYPCADAFTVTLTTYSWTRVPTTNCSGRSLIVLNNPASNTANIVGHVTTATTTSISTTTKTIELIKGAGDSGRGISEEGYLWLMSLAASAESVSGQEFRQR
jgi:hypothetical protein